MFVSFVMLLNYFNSLLNKLYQAKVEKASVEITFNQFTNCFRYSNDPIVGWLVSYPPPIFTIAFPLLPFYIFSSNKKKWNKVFMKVGYCFYLIIFVLAYILLNIFMIPIAYFKIIIEQLLFIYTVSRLNISFKCKKISDQITRLINWIVFGMLTLLYILLWNDLPLFLRSLFTCVDNRDRYDMIDIKEFRAVKRVIKGLITVSYTHLTLPTIYSV
eukprot:TRINITY_DN26069_c0_g1_i3.p1 TRINITY_DN26069_c0_g1~~TRINITY_DN26069_c0_g1_i3.p1  ORF type:complete len:215 (-),score=32.02 TRINITY_DN26069_c0_g1_i3:34-678(-)